MVKHFKGEVAQLWRVTKMFSGAWLRFIVKVSAVIGTPMLATFVVWVFGVGLHAIVGVIAPLLILVVALGMFIMTVAVVNTLLDTFWGSAVYE